MKDCKKIHPLLSLYQENELSPREKGQVENHLKACVTARRELEKFGRLHDVLKGEPEPPMPSDLHGRIMARIRGNIVPLRSPRSFWTKATWTLATAAVMAFLFINQYTDWGELRRGPSHVTRDESASGKSSSKKSDVKGLSNAPQPFTQAPAQAKKKQVTSQSFSGNLRSDDNEANRNFAGTLEDKDSEKSAPVPSAASAPRAAKAARFKSPAETTGVAGTEVASAPAPERRLNEMDQLAKKAEVKEAPASSYAKAPSDRAALPPSLGYSAGLKTLKISQEKLAPSWSGDNDSSPVEREDLLDSAESFNQAWKTFHPQEDPPEVDFTKNAVVLLLAGQKPTSGYSIHVTHLEENEDQEYVWYRVETPSAGSVVTQMITHPWTLQIIPKSSKPVVFQKE